MKRVLVTIVAALALPAAAQAKELNGITLCGPDGCNSGSLRGFGHQSPMSPGGAGMAAPPPGAFYRLSFTVDGHEDAWTGLYYEPRSGLIAFAQRPAGWMTWNRPAPAVAALAKRLARTTAPFPRPAVTEVRIGKRVLRDGASSYLALYGLDGKRAVPGDGPSVVIRFPASENPWTSTSILYYPEDGIVQTGAGTFVRLPADLAADVAAARPLGAGAETVVPWVALGIALAGAIALAALRWARRGAPRPERPARASIPSA